MKIPKIPKKAALVLAPAGEIVEQRSGDPIELAIAEARGDGSNETVLRDLVEALRKGRVRGCIVELALDVADALGERAPGGLVDWLDPCVPVERRVEVEWDARVGDTFPVRLVITASDRPSMLADVAKATIFLVDLADFAAVNAVYAEAFGDAPPARATIGVAALPAGARVEIEAVAVVNG